MSNSNSCTQTDSTRVRAHAQHNPTYLDGAIAHVGDAERKRSPALVDFNLFSVGRQHLPKADALLGLAEHLKVGNRQKRALETYNDGRSGKGRGSGGQAGVYVSS